LRPAKYLLLIPPLVLMLVASATPSYRAADSYPNLPFPIAREPIVVTTAGMGAEGLIVARMCDQLDLDYAYLFQATGEDLPPKGSLIVVVGVSPAGMASIGTTAAAEEQRVLELADTAVAHDIPLIVVHLGGRDRRGGLNDRFIRDLVPKASYVLVAGGGNYDGLFSRLTLAGHIPLTEVADINDIEVPLNSAFR